MRKLSARPVWVAALLLWVMFALSLTSLAGEGPTFDEQGFLVRGLAYLRGPENGGTRTIIVGHPIGLNALNAALLVADPTVRLPSDDPSWSETSFHRPAELFLWGIGNDVARTMFLARVPTIWLGLLLAAVVGRWAGQMAHGWRLGRAANGAGLLALALAALDPNILAHARLVTTDLGLAAAAVLAGYTLWRCLRRPSWRAAAVAGVGLGLLQNTKFTALLFVPLFGAVVLVALWTRRRALERRTLVQTFFVYPAVALLTLWATSGFQVGPLRAPLPVVGLLGGAAVPLADHFEQLLAIGNRLQVGAPSFLLGRYSDTGWWYYFPVAFVLKTPLPTLLLLAFAIFRIARMALRQRDAFRTAAFDLAALLIPAGGYFAIALTTDINLGYRHLLAVLPFLSVLTGVVVAQAGVQWAVRQPREVGRNRVGVLAAVAVVWLALATVWVYPHFISYFNALAGGPDNGWRALVDSNIDWGQDLGRLKTWMDSHGVRRVWLSYFGEGRPEYYGIAYDGLDSFPPRLMNPAARPFYPHDPAPGWYAISATTLQGVHFADHDQYRFFRERPADDKVGYSIFLYQVAPRGEPADLLLAGTQMDAMAAADFAQLGTNRVTPRWFEAGRALVLPPGPAPLWLLLPARGDLPATLRPFLDYGSSPVATGDGYHLFRAQARPPAAERPLALDGHVVAFGQSSWARRNGRAIDVLTIWRQEGAPRPIQIFVHVLDQDGQLVAQWDGLSAAWEGWRPGDTLVQLATVALPESAPTGVYDVVVGLYDPLTNQRWRFADGQDGVELGQFTVP